MLPGGSVHLHERTPVEQLGRANCGAVIGPVAGDRDGLEGDVVGRDEHPGQFDVAEFLDGAHGRGMMPLARQEQRDEEAGVDENQRPP
ncbi:MAG: hypothetical protein NDJ94_23130 [Vicinamibacteria bacterium]|nr:hypothetical protein [Vicinamibacteria bacterium]